MEQTLSGVIIGALATLGLGVMTLIGVVWKSKSTDAATYITTNAQLTKIVLDTVESVKKDLNAQINEIKAEREAIEAQLKIALDSNRIMHRIIREYIPASTLDEISDLPEDL